MNTHKLTQHYFMRLKQQALLVLFICYIPHITTEPAWLFIIFSGAIGYRLIADYFSFPPISSWMLFILMTGCLFFLYGEGTFSTEFFVRCLLVFIILKCLEIHSLRDLKIIIFCNFFLIFSALIIVQQLWIIGYLLVAILANLSIMLKLTAPKASLSQISDKSVLPLLIAIPISILLFFVFPRIDPLWQVPTASGVTGFSETMSPGSISEVFNDESVAMHITFKNNPILKGYWQGLILSLYNGESWTPSRYHYSSFFPLRALNENETADYEIILEPDQKRWLFYQGYPIAGKPNFLFLPKLGLIRQDKGPINQRFIYSLKVQSAPYYALDQTEYAEATQLPKNANPRLDEWAKIEFEKTGKDVKSFITFLHDYINQQSFWYTLTPPSLTSDRNKMDRFWFETQKGYCEYYTSAVTFILRAAGIPARVVVGYQGGQWNPISNVLTIQRNDAHAWLEYWQEGIGWTHLDPTTFIAPERIDPTIRNREIALNQESNWNISNLPWGRKIRYFLQSIQFFSERWFLYYNPYSQQNLLQNFGLGTWNNVELLQASLALVIIFFILLGLFYHWWQKRTQDALLLEYHLLQKEFQKFNISIQPSATLKQQCKSLINKVPALGPTLTSFIDRYEQLRLKQSNNDSKENKKETTALLKTLRIKLQQKT